MEADGLIQGGHRYSARVGNAIVGGLILACDDAPACRKPDMRGLPKSVVDDLKMRHG
jgi:hypothetical protein